MFTKRKFQKIEQDYTKILSKMEKNYSGDNIKIKCGELTGSVYCVDDQIKYIAVEATKMFTILTILLLNIVVNFWQVILLNLKIKKKEVYTFFTN